MLAESPLEWLLAMVLCAHHSVPEWLLVLDASLLPRHCVCGCVAALLILRGHPFLS
jgi:hypothetical protein